MNIDPDMELLSGTDPGKALTKALVQNEHVKNLVEECAEDLSSVNSVLKQELADGNPPPAVESALDKSEAVEGKVQEASAKLAVVNQALTSEVRREAALLKTGALQNAILNSANFSSIATDEQGVIQLIQRWRRAHAGLHGRRGDEQDHPGRHFGSAGGHRARGRHSAPNSEPRSRPASRRWCSRPRAASRTSTS
jgi:hypothetical protein